MSTDDPVRKARKLSISREKWKARSAEKQKQIRQLRVTVRDLSSSRDQWKQRAEELEQQLRSLETTPDMPSAGESLFSAFLGGLSIQTTPRLGD